MKYGDGITSTIGKRKSVLVYVCTVFCFIFLLNYQSSRNIRTTTSSSKDDPGEQGTGSTVVGLATGQHCVGHEQRPPILASTGITRGFHPVFVYSNVQESLPFQGYSQVAQDRAILALSGANDAKRKQDLKGSNQPVKYFVDLASNDAIKLSNTFHLEQNGWKGLCMEPNPMYWYRLAAYRQCTIVSAFVGGTEDGKEVDVILSNHVYGGIVGQGFDNARKAAEEKRNLVSISTVFQETQVPTVIDYMSLDVEGAETLVMQDFPFDTYKILFMTIERPKGDLRELMEKNGYKCMSKDLGRFGETLWFHEKSVALTQEEVEEIACKATNNCRAPRS